MKKFFCALGAVLAAVAALAQTPEEIISRMEQEMNAHEKDGMAMTADIKLPIIGSTSSRTWTLGDKMRVESTVMGVTVVTWLDGNTEWIYNGKSDEVEIKNVQINREADSNDAEMFSGITAGYDVSIKKETSRVWYLECRKSKSNKDKDAPKTMELAVAKSTFLPISLSAKASGVSMTMRDISFGVSEKDVTFNPADYPTAKITDKRK